MALVLVLGAMAVGPYADYTAARGRVDDLAAEQAALEQSVQELESEQQRLQDPAALEEEARSELGLTMPGEIPYIVVNPPTPSAPPAASAQEQAPPSEASLLDRLLDTVGGWLGRS